MAEIYQALRAAQRDGRSVALVSCIAGGPVGAKLLTDGRTVIAAFDCSPAEAATWPALAAPLLGRGETALLTDGDRQLFVESFVPAPVLYLIGGVHISVVLAQLARPLGFRTVVIDVREAFASPERFSHVDELITAWPDAALAGRLDARSSVAVLTHDPKLDDPALRTALRSPARYIGALGSPATHAKRLERLRAEGFSDADLARIHGPIGLPIGARTAAEIALSILAQVVQTARGGRR
jgi:xanthine dehydrogenase accessory factor